MTKISWILASTDLGTLLVNRLDYFNYEKPNGTPATDGVGATLLETGSYDPHEIKLTTDLLKIHQQYFGKDVVAMDCGANIGTHTIAWARALPDLTVYAIEAQEWVFYALCGNIAINNCYNVHALYLAVSDSDGTILIPKLDYQKPASYGSLEIEPRPDVKELFGQDVTYTEFSAQIGKTKIDSFNLPRLDLLKMDIEGMEQKALNGAEQTILRTRPIIMIENSKLVDKEATKKWFEERDYIIKPSSSINWCAFYKNSPVIKHLTMIEDKR